ncbi:hypothetical protein [Streptomyces sp. FxanaA7]|uniref:hypothetical protein n=1 Tax=Streptomyces sp. FxanaA7 TaxID=1265492 RepID=UPI000A50E15C|nr:hypothetical protein [Streptomyces sp. FxanaA7]
MSGLNAEQRGDMVERMLPKAAHLAVLVHGDGGPEDVREALAGLSEAEKNALIVVLAGLVDPDQPVGKALGWLDFNEHGAPIVPPWADRGSVRDLVPETAVEEGDPFDWVAVGRFVNGFGVDRLSDEEFLEAVRRCAARGMRCPDIDVLRRWPHKTTENWINRLRKRYTRHGREFPDLGLQKGRMLTEEEVIEIRERSAGGATDLELGMSFGMNSTAVGAICRGNSYPQYGGPIRQPRRVQHLEDAA